MTVARSSTECNQEIVLDGFDGTLKQEAEGLMRQGLYASQIARHMQVSEESVVAYLRLRVGEGFLRLSDLFFSYSTEKRKILKDAATKLGDEQRQLLQDHDLSLQDLQLFRSLKNSQTFAGDLYEYISTIEVAIHRLIEVELKKKFGLDELTGWWRMGIPENIRTKCVTRREADSDPSEPYTYTELIDLNELVNRNRLQDALPAHYRKNPNDFQKHMKELHRIRNTVMHPVKRRIWSKEDFALVRDMYRLFSLEKLDKQGKLPRRSFGQPEDEGDSR